MIVYTIRRVVHVILPRKSQNKAIHAKLKLTIIAFHFQERKQDVNCCTREFMKLYQSKFISKKLSRSYLRILNMPWDIKTCLKIPTNFLGPIS